MTRQISGETGRFVELIWFARGRITGVSELIAPTGSTVAAVVLGDPIRLIPDNADLPLTTQTFRWSPSRPPLDGQQGMQLARMG